ncbi:hypothetical protein DFH09DRAFT_1505231 [Mycena vulgaris]|nr:hypothetical protein DFH09DRAFT_1505231 [Mycena vulgaris]
MRMDEEEISAEPPRLSREEARRAHAHSAHSDPIIPIHSRSSLHSLSEMLACDDNHTYNAPIPSTCFRAPPSSVLRWRRSPSSTVTLPPPPRPFPTPAPSAPRPPQPVRYCPGPSASFSGTASLPNSAFPSLASPLHKMPRRAVPAIQTPTRHRSFRRPWTRMPPPPPRTSPAPACRETREGGESGDGGRRSARCRAAAAAPSTFPFAATLIAYADRHDEASLRTPDTHGHAFVSQRARARTYMKGTQDAEHDAALPHSCADDGALGGGAGAGSRAGTGTGRTRVPGGTSGGERVPRAARRRRRCGGDASSAARGASALPAIHRALRLRMGGCRSVPTTAHARGDAPAPSVEECAFELDADAAQLVVDGA